jgi:hypothetical protein
MLKHALRREGVSSRVDDAQLSASMPQSLQETHRTALGATHRTALDSRVLKFQAPAGTANHMVLHKTSPNHQLRLLLHCYDQPDDTCTCYASATSLCPASCQLPAATFLQATAVCKLTLSCKQNRPPGVFPAAGDAYPAPAAPAACMNCSR